MDDVRLVLKGLWFRRGVSLAVLVISALVVGGAVTGPLFLRAAGESVLQDTIRTGPPSSRFIEFTNYGSTATRDPLGGLAAEAARSLRQHPTVRRFAAPPVRGLESAAVVNKAGAPSDSAPLVYRDGVCAHLRLVAGSCPARVGDYLVSRIQADDLGWHVGDAFVASGVPGRVVGIYTPVDPHNDFWGNRSYFNSTFGDPEEFDAVFTTEATMLRLDPAIQLTLVEDVPIRWHRLRVADTDALRAETVAMGSNPAYQVRNISTAIPGVLTNAEQVRNRLTVPVEVVEAQLLLLCWLVLYLVAANAAESRGPEVALAKLRGVPPGSTVAFGLVDTLLLVALAAPLGLLLGWLWVHGLASFNLAPGTPVVLTRGSVLAMVGAAAGAGVAAALAGVRMLRRPVVEQWRRATRRARARSWLVDLPVVAASVGGLVLLARQGAVRGGSANVAALVAPGLVVLAAALLGSRALPALCRAWFPGTRSRGQVGRFLAVRQVARRPMTLRLGLVLAVAFGLVAFAVDAWSVSRSNQHDRAFTEAGAAQVLTVQAPAGLDVADVVDRLDPTGRQATAVVTTIDYTGNAGVPQRLIGVEPDRFAHIAFWRHDFTGSSLAAATRGLAPPAAPAVVVAGDRLAVDVTATGIDAPTPPDLALTLAVSGSGTNPVTLGPVRNGRQRLEAPVACEQPTCRVVALSLQRPDLGSYPLSGTLTVTGLQVHDRGGWHPAPGDLQRPGSWQPDAPGTRARSGPGGLTVDFHVDGSLQPVVRPADRPAALPVVATAGVSTAPGPATVAGIDGKQMPVDVLAVAKALPAAGSDGLLVDRTYALRAANGRDFAATDQVWLSASAPADFPARLARAGVSVLSVDRAADRAELLSRQGPALAILLFLAGAGLGALLAGGGAVLNLHLSGRRRGYELAAMAALGVKRRTLRGSLYAEQGLLLVFGVAVGVAAGVGGALLALPSVPEFADVPAAPPMQYGIHVGTVLGLVAAAMAVLVLAAAASAATLVRSARVEQLREAAT